MLLLNKDFSAIIMLYEILTCAIVTFLYFTYLIWQQTLCNNRNISCMCRSGDSSQPPHPV